MKTVSIVVVIIVVLALPFIIFKWMQARKLSSFWNRFHQGLIKENANQYAAALETYVTIIQQSENTKLANDPLLKIIKERIKTLQWELEFQNQHSYNNNLEKWNYN
jgi:hypothetical protein